MPPPKKKNAKPVIEKTKRYVNVGLGEPVLPMGFESKATSLNDGILDVQQRATRQRIHALRNKYNNLIESKDDKMATVNNIFQDTERVRRDGSISLSIYS